MRWRLPMLLNKLLMMQKPLIEKFKVHVQKQRKQQLQ